MSVRVCADNRVTKCKIFKNHTVLRISIHPPILCIAFCDRVQRRRLVDHNIDAASRAYWQRIYSTRCHQNPWTRRGYWEIDLSYNLERRFWAQFNLCAYRLLSTVTYPYSTDNKLHCLDCLWPNEFQTASREFWPVNAYWIGVYEIQGDIA